MVGRFRGIACVICALDALVGCGADGSSTGEPVLLAESGPFDGTLTIEPNPPHVGTHQVVITLDADGEGAPLEGAAVMLSPWMPAHGHGSTDVEAVEEAPGVYVAENVWLNMPGVWDLRVHVDSHQAAHQAQQGDLTATIEVP